MVLFEGRGGQDGFGVEQARELRDEGFALFEDVLDLCLCFLLFVRWFCWNAGGGGELRICVEKGVRLYFVSSYIDPADMIKDTPESLTNVPADGAVPSPTPSRQPLSRLGCEGAVS